MNQNKKFRIFVIFFFFSLIVSLISSYFGFDFLYFSGFISSNPYLSLLFYNIIFIVLTSLSFSVSFMTGAGVLFFSPNVVVLSAMIGIIGSSVIDYIIARKLGRDYFKKYLEKKGGKIEKFDSILEENNFKTITVLSAIFFVPPTLPNFLGGLMDMSLKSYVLANFIGNLPHTILTVYLIYGVLASNYSLVYVCIVGQILVTLIAMYFYAGEFKELLKISFPFLFKK